MLWQCDQSSNWVLERPVYVLSPEKKQQQNKTGQSRGKKPQRIVPCCQQNKAINRLGEPSRTRGSLGLNHKQLEKITLCLVGIGSNARKQQTNKICSPLVFTLRFDRSSMLRWWIANVVSHPELYHLMSALWDYWDVAITQSCCCSSGLIKTFRRPRLNSSLWNRKQKTKLIWLN